MKKKPAVGTGAMLRALACAAVATLGVAAQGQGTDGGFDPARLLAPAKDSWPTFHGEYSGQRHSALTQITPDNVRTLTLAWAFQTNQAQQVKATPILVDGILYLTAPDNLWAIDARSGRQIWRHQHPANDAFHIGHRGAAVYGNTVFLTTPDTHLIALDRYRGEVQWDVEIADSARGYWSTNAPLVIRNHLIVGVSGDFDNLPGILRAFDPATGEAQWTFNSTPPMARRGRSAAVRRAGRCG